MESYVIVLKNVCVGFSYFNEKYKSRIAFAILKVPMVTY